MTTTTTTTAAQIVADAIAASNVAVASPTPSSRRIHRMLEKAAAEIIAAYGETFEVPRHVLTEARQWRTRESVARGGGASLQFVTEDVGGSSKLAHNLAVFGTDVRQAITYMAPAQKGSCPYSTAGCRRLCLRTSGRLQMSDAPDVRSELMHLDPYRFVLLLVADVRRVMAKYRRQSGPDATLVYRHNGTTEQLEWENAPNMARLMTSAGVDVLFDYRKRDHMRPSGWQPIPGAPGVPFYSSVSISEKHTAPSMVPNAGVIVFDRLAGRAPEPLPTHIVDEQTGEMVPVVDGDAHDLRPFDATPAGGRYVVGLRAKGKAADVVRAARKGGPAVTWSTFIKPAGPLS